MKIPHKKTDEKAQIPIKPQRSSLNKWPESVVHLAGAWVDFPLAEEIRAGLGADAAREPFVESNPDR